MHTRIFAKDEKAVSEVGLGCWQIGGNWGEVSDATAHEILDAAVNEDISFFDTADVYGGGRSERLIGDFLSNRPAPVFVATKIGRGSMYPGDYSAANLGAAVDACRERLRMDTLDLVQLHCIPFSEMRKPEIWESLRALREAGKIRRFGASVESMEEAIWCVEHVDDLYSLQIIFNVIRQKPIETLFPKALEKGVGLIVRVPLASGLLSGQWNSGTEFDAQDHRNFNKDGEAFNVGETLAGLSFDDGLRIMDSLAKQCPPGTHMAPWALRWILDHPAVTTVIPGASRPSQVSSNASASALPAIPPELHQSLSELYEKEIKACIRGPY